MKNLNEETYDLDNPPANEYSSDRTTSNTTGESTGPVINVDKEKLNDPRLKQTMKDTNATVNVNEERKGLIYLSEVIDEKTGNISQPFSIEGKKYQIVRARNANNEKVQGVYSFDEVDERGMNKIYDLKEFEQNVVNAYMVNEKKEKNKKHSFQGYKHFIVNRKLGKVKKLGSLEELAKAKMEDDEEYMGLKQFKKYIDEVLFGGKKRKPMVGEGILVRKVISTIKKKNISK